MNNSDATLVKNEMPIVPLPIDDPICDKCIDNMRLRVYHKDNNTNNVTTLVMQLPKKLCGEKPSLGQADGKLKDY